MYIVCDYYKVFKQALEDMREKREGGRGGEREERREGGQEEE